MKVSDLVSAYIKARDKEAALKAEYEQKKAPVEEIRKKIEAKLLGLMNDTGMESIRTDAGTAYKSVRSSCTVADWDSFFGFVREEGAWDMLEHRASKEAVKQFREENDNIPPGLNWSETLVVNFRRS